MVLMDLFAGEEWRCRRREWTCVHRGEGEGGRREVALHIYTLSGVRAWGWRAAAEQRGSPVWGCVMAWRDGMRGREGFGGRECV